MVIVKTNNTRQVMRIVVGVGGGYLSSSSSAE